LTSKYPSSATVIPLKKAVGKVLSHDITEIRPGQFKGAAFKRGHVVTEEDIPHLRRLGKEHLYVLQIQAGELHEDEAALRLAKAFCGPGVHFDEDPTEGKIALKSRTGGLLKVDLRALTEINLIEEICCSSRHVHSVVGQGEIIAATRAIPLVVEESVVRAAEEIAQAAGGLFSVQPLGRPDTGLVVTGNEVFSGLIDDKFAPLIRRKLHTFDCRLRETVYAPDDKGRIVREIKRLLEMGIELILVGGGMSVDPDDVSRMAIAEAGAVDIVYGSPVLPGAMFLYGRFGDIPILGLPACVLFYRTTVFDLILPRVLAGEIITRRDLASLAHGGLCLNCDACRFPVCPFGKG
jgi:hypothetical protein